jgi:hypothetical protein
VSPLSTPSENSPDEAAPAAAVRHKIHCVLNNKGGIGKTLVSMNLIQFLRDRGLQVQAIDLDPMNHTLAEYPGMKARSVSLLEKDHADIQGREMDGICQSMLTEDASFVIDNGAAGFVRFGGYLVETEFSDVLGQYNRDLIIHAVVAGGDMTLQCIAGLDVILSSFPPSVKVVVWLNEHTGPVELNGKSFEDMRGYTENIHRIAGLVRLRRQPSLFLQDFNEMLRRRLTYAEAIDSPDFFIMNKQRLVQIRRGIWQQLEAIL